MNPALLASGRQDWQTPDDVLQVVRDAFYGRIDLDPCASSDSANHFAAENFTVEDDGLSRSWGWGQRVFVNPPFKWAARWIERCDEAYGNGEASGVIALIPARTDTRYWQKHVANAHAICFWRGRLKFKGAPGPAPFPTAFVLWGAQHRDQHFARAFMPRGHCIFQRGGHAYS